MLQAGTLRHVIKLYQPITAKSNTGAIKKPTWTMLAMTWGEFTHLSAKDAMQAAADKTEAVARLRIRWRKGVNHLTRVEYDGNLYDVVGEPLADNVGGREWLTMTLKRVKNGN